jgi:8-amino-7-oxononanoate synthase
MDGMRMAPADFQRFHHNDMDHLESLVKKNRDRYRSIWVVTESIFSMDGDRCPLAEIVALKERYGLQILLDEAHSFGLCGASGAGYASHLCLAENIDVITGSLGKALASTGGFVIADTLTSELLVNRMRTMIYSTALPSINLAWTNFLVNRLHDFEPRRRHLRALAEAFTGNPKPSQITPLIVGDNLRTQKAAKKLREAGFWASVVRHPTVARGTERVRVSLCASMTLEEIAHLKAVWGEVAAGLGIENSLR